MLISNITPFPTWPESFFSFMREVSMHQNPDDPRSRWGATKYTKIIVITSHWELSYAAVERLVVRSPKKIIDLPGHGIHFPHFAGFRRRNITLLPPHLAKSARRNRDDFNPHGEAIGMTNWFKTEWRNKQPQQRAGSTTQYSATGKPESYKIDWLMYVSIVPAYVVPRLLASNVTERGGEVAVIHKSDGVILRGNFWTDLIE